MQNNDNVDKMLKNARDVDLSPRKAKSTRGGSETVNAGAEYERDVARRLTEAFNHDFSRRVRKYKGDHDLETPYEFPFIIEVKVMASIDIYSAVANIQREKKNKTGKKTEVTTQLMKWWLQAVNQCNRVSTKRGIIKYPLLIWKQKGKQWLVSAPIPFMSFVGQFAVLHHYGFGIMTLKRFTEINYETIINYKE